jgi:periplasmic divalent cation tolerance protein
VTDSGGAIVVFITASSSEEVAQISDILLNTRKAAGVNIVSGMDSKYWWKGRLESSKENLLVVKTKASVLDDVVKLVKQIHSYEVPEIIAVPVIGGNQDYLKWIDAEVR